MHQNFVGSHIEVVWGLRLSPTVRTQTGDAFTSLGRAERKGTWPIVFLLQQRMQMRPFVSSRSPAAPRRTPLPRQVPCRPVLLRPPRPDRISPPLRLPLRLEVVVGPHLAGWTGGSAQLRPASSLPCAAVGAHDPRYLRCRCRGLCPHPRRTLHPPCTHGPTMDDGACLGRGVGRHIFASPLSSYAKCLLALGTLLEDVFSLCTTHFGFG